MDNENFLVYIKNQLEQHHIPYWLDTGNLLEYYRKDKIEHNNVDGDLGVLLIDYYRILDIFKNDSNVAFKALWNGEIAMYSTKNPKYHVDLFCYGQQGDKLYLYDYVSNKFTGSFDLERNATYEYHNIFPLQEVHYYNSIFTVPRNIETHLIARYGKEWAKPNPEWTWVKAENVIHEYKQYGILIFDEIMKQQIINTLPEKMYNLYYKTAVDAIPEPFIIVFEQNCALNRYFPISKVMDIFVADANIGIVSMDAEHINNIYDEGKTVATKSQPSYSFGYTKEIGKVYVIKKEKLYRQSKYATFIEPTRKNIELIESPKETINLNEITAIVTTINRPQCIRTLINSLQKYYPQVKILIGYQNPNHQIINKKNIEEIILSPDCGLAYARNKLVSMVKTPYTLLLDDDFYFIEQTNLESLLKVLLNDSKIGIVGGHLLENDHEKAYEKLFIIGNKHLFSINWKELYDKKIINLYECNDIKYGIADIIYNFFLARTDILKKYPWNEEHKVTTEHIEFFLKLKYNNATKIAFIPTCLIGHSPSREHNYLNVRERNYLTLIKEQFDLDDHFVINERGYDDYVKGETRNV